MTIATPSRDRQLACAMRWLFVGIIVVGVVCVFAYNKTAALQRSISQKMKIVEVLKLENAQLKNSYYSVLDTSTLIAAADRLGYVRDSNPAYLTFRADGTAVQDSPSPVSLNKNQ